jgi:hypothetical protein
LSNGGQEYPAQGIDTQSETRATEWAARVRDTLAAIAGAAAIVYIAGGLIVGLRLYLAGLPATSVVGQLPRNVLLSVGLGGGLFPALFLAAVYAAMRSAIYSDPIASADRLQQRTWGAARGWKRRLLYIMRTLALAAIIVAPAVASALQNRSASSSEARLVVLAPFAVVSWLGMLLYPNLRSLTAKTFRDDFRGIPATVLHSMLLALVLIPGCVAFWGTRPLDEAVLCTTPASGSRTDLRGYLVGQTTDNALIGDMSGPDRRVTSVPTAEIRRIIIGPKAVHDATCSPEARVDPRPLL